MTTYTWNTNKGVCYRIKYSDDTLTQDFVYNNVANLYRITDASGTRNITYNIYNEQETDAIEVNGDKHTITEKRDSFGRSSGYIHDKSGTVLQTIATDYDSTGRLSTSSFSATAMEVSKPSPMVMFQEQGCYIPLPIPMVLPSLIPMMRTGFNHRYQHSKRQHRHCT